jgi:anaphase-promoting complex subunit 1
MDFIQPIDPPSIYEWITSCLIARKSTPFLITEDISPDGSGVGIFGQYWPSLTPRIASFARFFDIIRPSSTPAEIVEALYASGITSHVLDTLPEAILLPLREAIVDCQAQPPVYWGKDLLNLVDREDVNMFLIPDQQRKVAHDPLLVSIPPPT